MENNQGVEKCSVKTPASTPPNKKIRILKVEEENVGKDRKKQKNPLNIPEIIAIVAGHISEVNDLKGVRSQSKAWRDETFLKWRSSAVFLINDESVPILAKAFEETDLTDLSEENKAVILKEKDPFGLVEVPFKNYRFANARNGQPWSYPLDKNDPAGKIIWDEVISPHATYLDVGECVLRKFFYVGNWKDFGASCLPGLNWILKHSPNVRELAIAPLQSSYHVQNLSDSDEDEKEEMKEVRRSLRNEVECTNRERRMVEAGRVLTNVDSLRKSLRHYQISSRIKKAMGASQIGSLTISTPQQKSFVRDDDTTLKPLINYEAEEVIDFGRWLFGGMLNLKHLELPTGVGSASLFTGLNKSRHSSSTQLESLTALVAPPHMLLPDALNSFISRARPPLRELRMGIKSGLSSSNFVFNDVFRILRLLQQTIEKLDFKVYCEQEESKSVNFSLGEESTFASLKQLKITMDSEQFQEFHFELNKIPKLQSFHFGINKKVFQCWAERKLEGIFVGNVNEMNAADEKLPCLEEFHFNGNLTRNALFQVGKITEKLKTLELVLDQENLPGLGNICPRLKKLKLLPGSNVPEEGVAVLRNTHPDLNIF